MKPIPIKALRRLYWAEAHIQSARKLAEFTLSLPLKQSRPINFGLQTGIVVSYARPFMSNDGIGSLDTKFRTFSDSAMTDLHAKLLDARDIIYAHKDGIKEKKLLAPEFSDALDKIEVKVFRDLTTEIEFTHLPFSNAILKPFIQLCIFQEERLNEESNKMLSHFAKGKRYKPGVYELGKTFP